MLSIKSTLYEKAAPSRLTSPGARMPASLPEATASLQPSQANAGPAHSSA